MNRTSEPFSGKWRITIESPMGPTQAMLRVAEDMGAVAGTFEGPTGTSPLSGRRDGEAIEFSALMRGPMGEMTLFFTGNLAGEEVEGEVQLDPRTVRWAGQRIDGAFGETVEGSQAVASGGDGDGVSAEARARPSLRRALVVFRERDYRYLWFSSASSFTGMQMQMVARGLLAWELTRSFGAVGIISLSFGLPMLAFSLFGGVAADRFDKRNLVLATQTATGTLSLATAFLVATDVITIQILFALGLFQGTFVAFGMPARIPLMAAAVGPERMMSAVALNGAAMNATRLVGPALAGAIIAAFGIAAVYFAQSFIYLATLGLLLKVPAGLGQEMGGPQRQGVLRDIGAGLVYVRENRPLLVLMAMAFIPTMLGMPYVMLLPGFVTDDLGRTASEFGLLLSISGAGALVGSVGVATLTEFPRKGVLQAVAGVGAGVGLILLGVWGASFGYGGAIAAVVILGLAFTAYQTLNNTLIIGATDVAYQGRVMSIYMLTFSMMPLMAAPLGVLADVVGATQLFVIQGAMIVVFMLLVTVTNPRFILRRSEGASPVRAAPVGPPV